MNTLKQWKQNNFCVCVCTYTEWKKNEPALPMQLTPDQKKIRFKSILVKIYRFLWKVG